MSSRCLLLVVVLSVAGLALVTPSHAQTTWYVDDDNCPGPGSGTEADPFCSIQAGIDEAVNGDTVLVADGSYTGEGNRDIDFGGRAITVRSENGPDNCVIYGSDWESFGFIFRSGEGLDSILQGFAIQGFYPDIGSGGAIRCIGSSPRIEENIIQWNESGLFGGGIYCENSNPTIRSNTIQSNFCAAGGGAIYCDFSSPSIDNNIISDNGSDMDGGAGIYCTNSSSPDIVNNKITENYTYTDGQGGGIYCMSNSSPLIMNNEIIDNASQAEYEFGHGDGGGIYCEDSSPAIINNLIVNNISGLLYYRSLSYEGMYFGGGIACLGYSAPTIMNNFIAGNSLRGLSGYDGYGGGIYCGEFTSPVITNNTIVDNERIGNIRMHGGGIYCDSSSAVIENCIVRDNFPDEIDGCGDLVTYSNVQGGYPDPEETNIDIDPHFVAGPDGCYYLSHLAAGQLLDSPCIDRGSNLAENICYDGPGGEICLDDFTTRIDHLNDSGTVDIGYHHGSGLSVPCPGDLSLVADADCFAVGETVTVRAEMSKMQMDVVGGQFNLSYDTALLDFLSADPGDPPFELEIYEDVDEVIGTIDYAVSAPFGDPGTSADSALAVLTFQALAGICNEPGLVCFRQHDPPTQLSDSLGQPVYPTLLDMDVIDNEVPQITAGTILACYANETAAEVAALAATAASDNCTDSGSLVYAAATAGDCSAVITVTVTDQCGNDGSVTYNTCIDGTTPVVTAGADIDVNADAGLCTAAVTWPAASATDNCDGDISASVLYEIDLDNNGSVDFTQAGTSCTFPGGTHKVTACASDTCSNMGADEILVTVSGYNEMMIDLALDGTVVSPLTRCITFELFDCGGRGAPTIVETEITFTGGLASGATILVPCGNYTCVTARDRLHTLARTVDPLIMVGTQFVAGFSSPLLGGNLNDDNWIDILDFAIFSWQYGLGGGDTDCTGTYPHADIDGDVLVESVDFTFIQINFYETHDPSCCGGPAPMGGSQPVTAISVQDLIARGLGQLAAGDLNSDGWLDQADVIAFLQGARPDQMGVGGVNKPLMQNRK